MEVFSSRCGGVGVEEIGDTLEVFVGELGTRFGLYDESHGEIDVIGRLGEFVTLAECFDDSLTFVGEEKMVFFIPSIAPKGSSGEEEC